MICVTQKHLFKNYETVTTTWYRYFTSNTHVFLFIHDRGLTFAKSYFERKRKLSTKSTSRQDYIEEYITEI